MNCGQKQQQSQHCNSVWQVVRALQRRYCLFVPVLGVGAHAQLARYCCSVAIVAVAVLNSCISVALLMDSSATACLSAAGAVTKFASASACCCCLSNSAALVCLPLMLVVVP